DRVRVTLDDAPALERAGVDLGELAEALLGERGRRAQLAGAEGRVRAPEGREVLLDQVEAFAQRHDTREPRPLDAKARFGRHAARILRNRRNVAITASRKDPGTHCCSPKEKRNPTGSYSARAPGEAWRTPGSASNWSLGPCWTTRPMSMTKAWLETSSAATTSCSTTRIARPSRLSAISASTSCSTSSGERPSESSSIMSRRGALMSPRPMAHICCSPPDMVPAAWVRRSASLGKME